MTVLRRAMAALAPAGVLAAATACEPPPPSDVIEVEYLELPDPGEAWLSSTFLNGRGEVVATWGTSLQDSGPSYVWHEGDAVRIGDDNTWPLDISNEGHVVGTITGNLPFLWTDGEMTMLPLAGAAYGVPSDVNDHGQVAGRLVFDDPGGGSRSQQPVVWDDGQILRPPEDAGLIPRVRPVGINNRGQVLLTGVGEDSRSRSWLWQLGGDVIELQGQNLGAQALNERGMVLGFGNDRAFLWHEGELTDLGTLGGDWALAQDLNEWGQIVGRSDDADGNRRGFLWHEGEMTDLGVVGGENPYSGPVAINNWGQVIGLNRDANGFPEPFLWQNDRMVNLAALTDATGWWDGGLEGGPVLMDINDRGQIIGAHALPSPGVVMWTVSPTWGYYPDGL